MENFFDYISKPINPEDVDCWILLAQCYKAEMEEMLMEHPVEIAKSRKQIANTQRVIITTFYCILLTFLYFIRELF